MHRLGLDIGGTKTEAALFSEQGEVLEKQRHATQKATYAEFLTTLSRLILGLRQRHHAPFSIGLCLPGSVSPLTGLVKNSNILVLNGQPLQRDLREQLQQPVAIANDGNCFALSEAVDGAGRDHEIVFGVTLGTGCGGGLSIGKRMITGNNGNAAECGHNPLPGYTPEQDGPPVTCYCGQQNCVESFVSGTGLSQRFAVQQGETLPAAAIIERMRQGDPAAVAQFALYRDQLARTLASVVNHLDPGAIVLGGGLSNVPEIYPGLEALTGRYTFTDTFTTRILPALHGDSSGVRGAAWLGTRCP
ncbi:ROK family protein [Chimaeribacter arupi]|uniref:ROK family protein n=1 Tax=Chimaeribacter arupi TaxID=2060066 RepID=UPI002947F53A|nr:ROK family protein [Chimaeribacter arupi]MDV5141103.1 ROK family protein [Chimaeribacter arupi]